MRLYFSIILALVCLAFAVPSVLAANYDVQFPNDRKLAQLTLVTASTAGGKTVVQRKTVNAQGKLSIPDNCMIEIILAYDGVVGFPMLRQLHARQIVALNSNKQELEDAQLAMCADWTNLLSLKLNDSLVTDKSIPIIAGFTKLTELELSRTDVRGSNFELLKNLVGVTKLNLQGLSLVPGALTRLLYMKNLEAVDFARDSLTDEDMTVLSRFEKLYIVSVNGNQKITNAGLIKIAGLKRLYELHIVDTQANEDLLPYLEIKPRFVSLTVRASKFWKKGVPSSKKWHFAINDATRTYQVPTELFNPLH